MPEPMRRTIWVGGLPKDVEEDVLLDVFERCGRIVQTQIRHSKVDTFAFLTFADDRGYDKALQTMDQSKHWGTPIKVNVVLQKPGQAPPGGGGGGGGGDRGHPRAAGGGGRGPEWRDDSRDAPPRRGGADMRDARNGSGGRDWQDDRPPVRRNITGGGGGGGGDIRNRSPPPIRAERRPARGGGDFQRPRPRSASPRGDGYGGGGGGGGRFQGDGGGRARAESRPRGGRAGGGARGGRYPSEDYDSPARQDTNPRLWVGGMPKDITEREIKGLFSKHGPVHEVDIHNSEADTFAFVQYGNPSHALFAIKELNQSERFGGVIKVQPAGGKGKGDKKGGKGEGKARKGNDRRDDFARRSRTPPRRFDRSPPRGRQENGRSPRGRQASPKGNRKGKGKGKEGDLSMEDMRNTANSSHDGVRYSVKLGALPLDMDHEELIELGDAYGKVVHSSLWADAENACNAGVLDYNTREEALKALLDMNDRRMDGWERKLTACLEQKDSAGPGRRV